jgi:ABC-type transport system involved in multi-copper enzyme maturation permease subunit
MKKSVIINFFIILIVIFIISVVLSFVRNINLADVSQKGFPLIYKEVGTMPTPSGVHDTPTFYPIKLIIDIIIWIVLALGISYLIYRKKN